MNDERKELEQKVVDAVLDLFGGTLTQAFVIPVPNTTPILYVVSGGRRLLEV